MALSVMPRVERLHLADVLLPQGHPAAPAGGVAVVFGFVIDHPDGAIVVDTGVGTGNEFIDQAYSPTVRDLEATLLGVGIEPTSVVAVVNRHRRPVGWHLEPSPRQSPAGRLARA